MDDRRLGLVIGNCHCHWAWFEHNKLVKTWDSAHLSLSNSGDAQNFADPDNNQPPAAIALELLLQILINTLKESDLPQSDLSRIFSSKNLLPLCLASVVPAQTQLFQTYPRLQCLTLADIPIHNLYPTLGIDRALALYGAGGSLGWPTLVIDGGTALTLTGGDRHHSLVGGAILPGIGLQFHSLGYHTAALPSLMLEAFDQAHNSPQGDHSSSVSDSPRILKFSQGTAWPERWSCSTEGAIVSGILHTVQAGVQDFVQAWLSQFPDSSIGVTGGDAELIGSLLQRGNSLLQDRVQIDRQIIFKGMQPLLVPQRSVY